MHNPAKSNVVSALTPENLSFTGKTIKLAAMALSQKDKAFYEEKLNYKSIGYLFGATTVVGAISWPLLLYIQDWASGDTSTWSLKVVSNLAVMGFLLGSVVAVIMYLAFKGLLEMGWLPSRPRQ